MASSAVPSWMLLSHSSVFASSASRCFFALPLGGAARNLIHFAVRSGCPRYLSRSTIMNSSCDIVPPLSRSNSLIKCPACLPYRAIISSLSISPSPFTSHAANTASTVSKSYRAVALSFPRRAGSRRAGGVCRSEAFPKSSCGSASTSMDASSSCSAFSRRDLIPRNIACIFCAARFAAAMRNKALVVSDV